MVLLELLSGRRAVDKNKVSTEQILVDWAKPFLGDKRKLFRIMDTRLEGQYSKKSAFAVANLALQCISTDSKQRPQMRDVLAVLETLHDAKEGTRSLQMEQRDVSLKLKRRSHASPRRRATNSAALPSQI